MYHKKNCDFLGEMVRMLRFFEKYGVKEYYMYDRLVLTKAIERDGCALVREEQLHEALYSELIAFLDAPSLINEQKCP